MYRQDPPFCVQVELTEGCNLRCPFCGINGIRGPKDQDMRWNFMPLSTAQELAQQIARAGWNARIEFAVHGEPTLNPSLLDIVQSFRSALPRAYMLMESNGGTIVSGTVHKIYALFRAGLNTLAFDQYKDVDLVPRIRKKVMESEDDCPEVVEVYEYPENKYGNPHQRSKGRRLVFIAPIDQSKSGTHACLNNHCGCGAPPNNNAAGKRCAKPFREITVRWNGNIALCCNDWRGVYKCGNILDTAIEEIWQNGYFVAARKKLYYGERDFGACKGCDARSYRPGLLPDHMGHDSLPPAEELDNAVIAEACSGDSYAAPVLRPWELVEKDGTRQA